MSNYKSNIPTHADENTLIFAGSTVDRKSSKVVSLFSNNKNSMVRQIDDIEELKEPESFLIISNNNSKLSIISGQKLNNEINVKIVIYLNIKFNPDKVRDCYNFISPSNTAAFIDNLLCSQKDITSGIEAGDTGFIVNINNKMSVDFIEHGVDNCDFLKPGINICISHQPQKDSLKKERFDVTVLSTENGIMKNSYELLSRRMEGLNQNTKYIADTNFEISDDSTLDKANVFYVCHATYKIIGKKFIKMLGIYSQLQKQKKENSSVVMIDKIIEWDSENRSYDFEVTCGKVNKFGTISKKTNLKMPTLLKLKNNADEKFIRFTDDSIEEKLDINGPYKLIDTTEMKLIEHDSCQRERLGNGEYIVLYVRDKKIHFTVVESKNEKLRILYKREIYYSKDRQIIEALNFVSVPIIANNIEQNQRIIEYRRR